MTPDPNPAKTRVAILRTVGNLHAGTLKYDLESLRSIVLGLAPDLLCAEITRQAWEEGDLTGTPLEVQEALVPVIATTDTVLVPVAPTSRYYDDFKATQGWRQNLAHQFESILEWGQRAANTAEGVNGSAFEAFCHTVCALEASSWTEEERTAHQAHTEGMAENILQAVRRDPGTRVLIVVQCQWHHNLEPLLRRHQDQMEIVDYRDL